MALTRSALEAAVADYREEEPFYPVEREGIETLPSAFRSGEFGRRDATWVVRWYYRRLLGAIPNAERRRHEDAFERNPFDDVHDAIVAAATAIDRGDRSPPVAEPVERLTALEGVDVPVASAFLFFGAPECCIVVGDREWETLRTHGHLERPYPESPSLADYRTYLDRCRSLADRFDCDMWWLYRGLWRLSTDEDADTERN
ncbi:hypothetical protein CHINAEXTREME_08975 [Halobiforma lacisalsi AJ5]|uniref:Uncharacterized protein n=1 Tax=Natronobacterium lacisalsi AJ5 TaxID=358396 RepID=M0L7V0_NATLA|nr:hypothetical protein [Halobiforma lacisalsi]APW97905.1 hypothetical protein CHINAEXTREME_08975 [Halobiforma lacisalsi AJ5]EMA29173.1 hypothetical protein C445_17544 [Halobiforma lacisalsi AJ5]